ncbi:MAG: type I-C CRISPR-associated protein Cas8c/Csd1 [Candidatus Omnitrophota bacterium]
MLNYLPKGESEPGFTSKIVRWAMVFDNEGDFLEALDLADPNDKKRKGRLFEKCPDLSQPELVGGNETRCHFLIETTSVVTLLIKKDEEEKNIKKSKEKHSFFVKYLHEVSSIFPFFEKVAHTISDQDSINKINERFHDLKAKPSDSITLALKNEFGIPFPVEMDVWHNCWREFRSSLEKESKKNGMISILSGQSVEPLTSNPTIKGLSSVGGLATGDRLISFDKDAFCSYGLQQGSNCAVSEAEAFQYRNSLNGLIQNHGQRIGEAFVVPWFKTHIPEEENPFQILIDPGENEEQIAQKKAKELLQAIHTGKRTDLSNNVYYALTLSGAAGRVMVRDWMEGSFESLVQNIERWFEDFSITRNDGSSLESDPKFMRIVFGLSTESQELPAPHIALMVSVY